MSPGQTDRDRDTGETRGERKASVPEFCVCRPATPDCGLVRRGRTLAARLRRHDDAVHIEGGVHLRARGIARRSTFLFLSLFTYPFLLHHSNEGLQIFRTLIWCFPSKKQSDIDHILSIYYFIFFIYKIICRQYIGKNILILCGQYMILFTMSQKQLQKLFYWGKISLGCNSEWRLTGGS